VGTDEPLPLPHSIPVAPEQMIDHIRARRSVRHFRRQPVPRQELERIIDAARYAPTGSNMQSTCLTVIAAPGKIEAIRRQVLANLEKRVRHWESLAEAHEIHGTPIPEELRPRVAMRDRYRNMVEMAEAGRDVIFHQAPALILLHDEPAGVTPKDDADLAAMCILLVAHSMGLGTCLIGLLTAAMGEDPSLRDLAQLPPGHQVFTSLVIGYPRLQFRRAPGRKPARVRWL
jgi:nitroreductase